MVDDRLPEVVPRFSIIPAPLGREANKKPHADISNQLFIESVPYEPSSFLELIPMRSDS